METKRYYSSRLELIKSRRFNYLRFNLHRIIYRDGTYVYRISRVFDGVIELAIIASTLRVAEIMFDNELHLTKITKES